MTEGEMTHVGSVIRVVDTNLAYVQLRNDRATITVSPTAFEDGVGRSLAELSVSENSELELVVDSNKQYAVEARLARVKRAVNFPAIPERQDSGQIEDEQMQLLPDMEPQGRKRAERALPAETRKFGKLINCSNLRAGDLLLTRDVQPEWVGTLITKVQLDGGYSEIDARWSHAAIYVGDGEHVVEATFDSVLKGGDVRLTSLDEYCKGDAILRFRRSKYFQSDNERWRFCIRALSRMRLPYNFNKAIEMWFKVVIRKIGFHDENERYTVSQAVICSTLFADAYNEATRRSLGEVGGACVPAWLSASSEFDDVAVSWIAI